MKSVQFLIYFLLLGMTTITPSESVDEVVLPKYMCIFGACGPTGYNFYSAASDDILYVWHPWRARIINTEKIATTWYFDSHSKTAEIDILKVKTKTYKPYPAQDISSFPGTDHYTATIKVYLAEQSICQDVYFTTTGGYNGYYQGAGKTIIIPPAPFNPFRYDYSELNSCSESQRLAIDGDSFANYGHRHFKQTDYPGIHYGDSSSKATIPQYGCFLCSMCGIAWSKGIYCTPTQIQDWLESQTDGYVNHLLVNPLAFLRWVNQSLNGGRIYTFRRNVPVDEALDRDLGVQDHVRSGRHWVMATAHKIRNENSPLRTAMLDPMFDRRGFTTLEDYSGVNKNDTRCWFWKNTWFRAYLLSQADWGSSGIIASTMDNVGLTLFNSGGLAIETASPVILEDAMSGTTPFNLNPKDQGLNTLSVNELSEVNCGRMLLVENIPSDNYKVEVNGTPGAVYEVKIYNYDEKGRAITKDPWGNPLYVKAYTGTFGESGKAIIEVPHVISTTMGIAVSPEEVADGTGITYDLAHEESSTIVTAVIPNVGFYVQSLTEKVKPILIMTSRPAQVGEKVTVIRGKVATLNGQKCISIGDYDLIDKSLPTGIELPKSIGISPEKANTTWHFYARSFGRVTEKTTSYLVLNGHLKVWCPENEIVVGDFISAEGVEHGNRFFVGIGASLKRVE